MTPADIDRVFGRGRLRMVTGEHVEVYREASLPGERRRYTKRFLATEAGDFRHWTEREWRILARLVGHGIGPVPDVVQFDRGAADRPALVQTYDAGVTVDHWATLLPVERDGAVLRHVFEDCAHWWALARHCLIALDAIHELQLVHLDLKADNVCIPFGPPDFEPQTGQLLSPRFEQIALIDFAFSLVSGEGLTRALPIVRQTEYDYQSPRLLQALEAGGRGDLLPTRQLDWRCDVFSLAAMLRRYLPDPEGLPNGTWTQARHAQARALVRRLLEAHDAEWLGQRRPHAEVLALTAQALADPDLVASLARGWTLSVRSGLIHTACATPVTRIALPVSTEAQAELPAIERLDRALSGRQRARRWSWVAAAASVAAIAAPPLYDAWWAERDRPLGGGGPALGPVLARAPAAAESSSEARAADAVPPAPARPSRGAAAPAARESVVEWPAEPALPPTSPQTRPVEPTPQRALAASAPPDAARGTPEASPVAVAVPAPAAPSPPRRAKPAPAARTAPSPPPSPPRVAVAAPARATPSAKGVAREPERTVARTASVASPLSDRERALAWLTARGPSPRGVGATSATAAVVTPAVAGAPPSPASASPPAPAPMPIAVASPPRDAPTPAPRTLPTAVAGPPAPVTTPREVARSDDRPASPVRDFGARGRDIMVTDLPQLAQRAERRVLLVFDIAARPASAGHDDEIRRAAGGIRNKGDEPMPVVVLAADEARTLTEEAWLAFRRRGSQREAIELQLQAFGANPLDPEVAGSLAFLWLKQGSSQAERARQLALHALTLPDPRGAAAPLDDWTTLAIASALAGRERDARLAWFVTLALAPQTERQCKAAINAYALHGERLRAPVEAMLYRVHLTGRAPDSALCEWPPHWVARR
jgi:hypothetical protein